MGSGPSKSRLLYTSKRLSPIAHKNISRKQRTLTPMPPRDDDTGRGERQLPRPQHGDSMYTYLQILLPLVTIKLCQHCTAQYNFVQTSRGYPSIPCCTERKCCTYGVIYLIAKSENVVIRSIRYMRCDWRYLQHLIISTFLLMQLQTPLKNTV